MLFQSFKIAQKCYICNQMGKCGVGGGGMGHRGKDEIRIL